MAGRYQCSEEEIKAIEQKRKENKDKRREARLKALELRAKGAKAHEVAAATGFHAAYVTQLVGKYRNNGLRACLKTFDKNDLEVDNKEKQAGAEDRCINTQAISVGRNTIRSERIWKVRRRHGQENMICTMCFVQCYT